MATHELDDASPSPSRPRIERVESLIPVEDYDLRLALIEDIRKVLRLFRGPEKPDLTGLEFSYLINMLLEKLRPFKVFFRNATLALEPVVSNMGPATWWFLQKNGLPEESQNNSSASKGIEANRSDRLRDECLDLDGGCCVVTGASNPQVCHIVPFAWSKNEKSVGITKRFVPALELVIDVQPPELLFEAMSKLQEGVGCTERLWNLVCPSPQLHKWWDHAYFGLMHYGSNDSEEDGFVEIHLQFVWMPRNIPQFATKQITLDQQAHPSTSLSAGLNHHFGGQTMKPCSDLSCNECQAIRKVKAYDITNRPIVNGQIIVVKRRKEDAPLFEAMIKIQYVIIRAAAISGGALAPGELRDEDLNEGEAGEIKEEDPVPTAKRIEDWLDCI
ncbi:hypothetical protein FANTH_6524 [Fusarium anthophilum]|uniref:HNH nuclease domain-containing protein n=1 Tax=Fusarium anthophilum TaxID=48485 RepID=A0A8H5E5C7_9HYPO|nr:hypothetical protein FANTH_6524 [Fusarium anthophilum]